MLPSLPFITALVGLMSKFHINFFFNLKKKESVARGLESFKLGATNTCAFAEIVRKADTFLFLWGNEKGIFHKNFSARAKPGLIASIERDRNKLKATKKFNIS